MGVMASLEELETPEGLETPEVLETPGVLAPQETLLLG
jgi:hypothetical protein